MTHQTTTPAERNTRSMNDVRKQLQKQGLYRREMGICYATSRDGLTWEKPYPEIYPWGGEKSNVPVFGLHGAGVFKDPADPDPNRRYKMIAKIGDGGDKPFVSPQKVRIRLELRRAKLYSFAIESQFDDKNPDRRGGVLSLQTDSSP